jgi:hypothetical protein
MYREPILYENYSQTSSTCIHLLQDTQHHHQVSREVLTLLPRLTISYNRPGL